MYKYLGIYLDSSLESDATIDMLAKAGSRALSYIIGKSKSNLDVGFGTFNKLYHSCVVPVLDYACGAWYLRTKTPKLDQIQQRASHFYMGLPKNCSLLAIEGEIGWVPGVVRRDLETLRLYNQFVKMPRGRLTRDVFEYECEKCRQWYQNLSNLCICIDKHTELLENVRSVLLMQKKDLLLIYNRVWKEELKNNKKLETYAEIKDYIKTASYVRCNLDKSKRSLVGQLICGCLGLEIEMGRYTRTPRELRLCKMCGKAVESDCHFLFHCEKLQNERIRLYHKVPELLNYVNDLDKIKLIMNMPYTLDNYVYILWKKREEIMKLKT